MTDQTPTLTQPYIPLIIILAVLIFVGGLAYSQAGRLSDFFFAQAAINGAILLVAVLSAALIIWEVFSLSRAIGWVDGTRITSHAAIATSESSSADMPQLLFPLQSLMNGKVIQSGFSTENLSIVMDAIKARNDERRDLSQYLLQLLIFLGLFGTFWGLTLTVGDIGKAIGQLNQESASRDAGDLFGQMIQSLEDPIGSMGIAFSSSLFGLAGTIIVGFLEQQSAQAHGRFIDELENWLYQHAILSSAGTGGAYPVAATGTVVTSSGVFSEEVLTATNAKLEQIDIGLARNHDALIAALQSLVAVQEDQKAIRKEEHGKLSSLAMLTDTNERMNSIMEMWNRRSEQYFDELGRGQAQLVKVAEDMERLLKARDTTRTLNDRLAELSRELGDNARRTENAFTNLRDFLSGSETGNQLQALLESMESSREELRAMREEAASRGTSDE
ncbi:MAG: hypothetical protein CBC49_009405 [Alphaproteobacteria bacterium TMED89]|nr:hypothetical protein [Rhodospirillaceae bacterium]RPH11584.1 MAG: hypothetical protein CBC49_009405 [Alphaproteobacteria bacterium TMED89]